ncbi:Crp/Fnr family transcriptional regulator [Pedobacter caeni]|uniref:cAMP-binding domain of CRP or a regulatory subunit of cAMP-dependent protein kinases n=1 Tax=Pedobacter caeni TaxID=288992 RepID=A0A1M5A7W8_9SPHI|nr:Crp/Fnr family transcriptional regulator [Pedobacter caeni]SHF25962.1 cAMP-binding domain of CRP or a regulatory subunit of cAMP-dependent protein kinases [Pedobacter caeni]
MLRTNHFFLSFIENLHEKQANIEELSLKTFPKGTFLLKQDGRSSKVFIIKEGITKCFFSEENGKDYIVEFLSEGEILGEIEAIRNNNCLCSVETLTDVEAYAINIPFFKQLLEKDLNFQKLLLDELAERLINTSSRASSQQLYTIEYGLKKILELQYKQNIVISKEDMAAYLGITLRSLNRALTNLK